MPAAARLHDPVNHTDENAIGAGTEHGDIASGSGNVFINGRPAARAATLTAADEVRCSHGATSPSLIAQGSRNVFINGQPAARVGDATTCGGKISIGSSNVFIGGGRVNIAERAPVTEPSNVLFGESILLKRHRLRDNDVTGQDWRSPLDGLPLSLARNVDGRPVPESEMERAARVLSGWVNGKDESTALKLGARPLAWDKTQVESLTSDLNRQREMLHQRLFEINRWDSDDRAFFKKSYGTDSSEARAVVRERLISGIKINAQTSVYDIHPAVRRHDQSEAEFRKVGASVHRDSPTRQISVTPSYWQFDGYTRSLILAHEMSHFVGSPGTELEFAL